MRHRRNSSGNIAIIIIRSNYIRRDRIRSSNSRNTHTNSVGGVGCMWVGADVVVGIRGVG